MIPRRMLPSISATVAFVLLGLAVPEPYLQITFFVASFACVGWVIVDLFRYRDVVPKPLVEDDKHIILFHPSDLPDSQACPHCGETLGLGIQICPRCKRPTA